MTQAEQQRAAKDFAEFWQGKGDEKQEIQREIVAELFKLYQQAVEK